MTLSMTSFKSPIAKKIYIGLGVFVAVLLVLYIVLRVFVAHAQSVANKNMNFPCPRYFFSQHPTLSVGANDANRPDKCVHYFQTLYNISLLDKGKKENSKVAALIPIDGIYTPAQGNALIVFQKDNSLKQTGKVDAKTWYQLELNAQKTDK